MTGGFWNRLKSGLRRSSDQLGGQLNALFSHRKLDSETLEKLEEILIQNDLGVETAQKICRTLLTKRLPQDISQEELLRSLSVEITSLLLPVAQPLKILITKTTAVVFIVGVNGSGKTTTLSKLTKQWLEEGKTVEWAACDTFRAAAVEQLKIWGERLGVPVHTAKTGADAAGLAFDSLQKARSHGVDILCIDTAGRLHNKEGLMDELQKIVRVIKKIDANAPHHTVLVLDATTGQNAHAQLSAFKNKVDVTGLVVTKLDGTAKGGVIVGLAERYGLPIHAIGTGESADDLHPFTAEVFSAALTGVDP